MAAKNETHSKKRISSFFLPARGKRLSSMPNASEPNFYEDAQPGPEPRLPSESSPRFRLRKTRMTSGSSSSSQVNVISDPRSRSTSTTRTSRNVSRGRNPRSSRPTSKDSREGSRSRSQTPNGSQHALYGAAEESPESIKLGKKRAWFPSRTSGDKVELTSAKPRAWVAGFRYPIAYDLQALLHGEAIPDLWPEYGDTYVYFFPKNSGRGPSIKTHSSLLEASSTLTLLSRQFTPPATQGEFQGMVDQFSQISLDREHGSSSDSYGGPNFSMPTGNPTDYYRLYLPLNLTRDYSDAQIEPSGDDLELLVMYRNFFAFLAGGGLVATPRQTNIFSIFTGISGILNKYQFDEEDEASFGQVVSKSFDRYCDELRLANVGASREKTIEAIVLGEMMRSWPLYYNGFVHAAGRLKDIKDVKSPKYAKISPTTIRRLERATIDIEAKLLTVRSRLQDFDFHAMFSGLANSQSSVESKIVRFKEWKSAFMAFKRHVVGYYRNKYGAWPPKPGSNKHTFEVSGLSRLVLKEIYHDFCDLYDMLVDRSSMTTRDQNLIPLDEAAALTTDVSEATRHALRRVEGEYDSSDVPIHPPIPFDVPLLPTFTNSFNRSHLEISDESMRSTKRLSDSEVNDVLLGSYNRASMQSTEWIQGFITFERRTGTGKTLNDLIDLRIGQWLFVYAVLQSLPLVVVDAEDVRFSKDAEYFLCQAPHGRRPWVTNNSSAFRTWPDPADRGIPHSQSSNNIDNSSDGVYFRSHCWAVATTWVPRNDTTSDAKDMSADEDAASNYDTPERHQTPPFPSPYQSPESGVSSPEGRVPTQSLSDRPLSRMSNRSSRILGLEMTGPPTSNMTRPLATYDPDITFDDMLGTSQMGSLDKGKTKDNKKKKKGKK